MLTADWWATYSSQEVPELARVAVKVLSQTISASQCERNWSTFSLIHSRQRNRLHAKRLDDLVYCHYNMRLRMKIVEI